MPKNTNERRIDAVSQTGNAGTTIGSITGVTASHVLATINALGVEHRVSGLTAGQVLRAMGPTSAAFQMLQDADLPASILRATRTITAGPGLTGGGDLSADRTITVGQGLGITVNADDVALTTPGSLSASSINSSTGSHTHALDSSIARSAITLTAGGGLTGGGDLTANRTFTVGAGTLITVNADDVALANGSAQYQVPVTGANPFTPAWTALSTFAGGGLVFGSGVFAVGAGVGITVNADDVALTTPGSLSASSANSSTGSHTHAVVTSSNPGAAAAILATSGSGYLQLVRLGIGMAPTYPLDVAGDIRTSGDIYVDGGMVDFGTNYLEEAADFELKGAKEFKLNQKIKAASWSMTTAGALAAASAAFTGGATFGSDVTVGSNVLFVNVAGTRVGINRAPDQQFDLDVAGPIRGTYLVGKHAIQLSAAAGVFHFDGPEPYNLLYTGTNASHLGVGGTEAGSVIYRTGKFGKSLQLAETTTNLITNPSFETNTTGWAGVNGTLSQIQTTAVYGASAASLVAGVSTARIQGTLAVTGGATYTISLYVYSLETNTNYPYLNISQVTGTPFAASSYCTAHGAWQRLSITVTPPADVATIYIRVYTSANHTIYVDAIQAEQKDHLTPYCDGSLSAGHTWSGTPNASGSSRTATATLTYPSALLTPNAGTIMLWARPSGATTEIDASSPVLFYHYNSGNRIYIRQLAATWSGTIGANIATGGTVTPGAWHHIAITWSAGVGKLFVNGIQCGADIDASGLLALSSTFMLGSPYPYNGLIDDLVIVNAALDPDLIRAIYESDAPVFVESSVFHWRAPGKANIWVDEFGLWASSVNGNHVLGIYTGDPRGVATFKTWGGLNLEDNDILIGRTTGGYVHWDDSAQALNVNGAITATSGSITGAFSVGATLTIGAGGLLVSGATTYAAGTGYVLDYNNGTPRLRIGTTAGNRLTWDGTTLTIVGEGSGITAINGGNITTGTITATQIAASTITATQIAAGTITATQIAAGTITATQIAASTITAAKLTATNLSGLFADMGTLTAGSIVIGSTNKIWLNDSADGALNIGGATKASAPFRVTATGALTATNATLTGSLTAAAGNVTIDTNGMRLNALQGKYSVAAIEWLDGATRKLSIGTQVDLGVVVAAYVEASVALSLSGSTLALAATTTIGLTGTTLTFNANTIWHAGNLTPSSYLRHDIDQAGTNSDLYFQLGRAKIGYVTGAASSAAFINRSITSVNGATDYALSQTQAGATYINAKSGTAVHLRLNDAEIAYVDATGINVYAGTVNSPNPYKRSNTDGFIFIPNHVVGLTDNNGQVWNGGTTDFPLSTTVTFNMNAAANGTVPDTAKAVVVLVKAAWTEVVSTYYLAVRARGGSINDLLLYPQAVGQYVTIQGIIWLDDTNHDIEMSNGSSIKFVDSIGITLIGYFI